MASTPIYNWPTPDNTDLVKNGALAIRTLGDAIDTTVDTMIPETIFAAKGDLLGASANDTPAVLTVGANGETLVADSSATTGLRWQGDYAAGKNKIINGDMRISQRGTSFTIAANSTYTLDRYIAVYSTALPTAWTVSQETFTPGAAPVAGYEAASFLRSALTTIGTATAVGIRQLIEDVRTFAGQTVTLSFYAKADANCTISVTSTQNFGAGGSGAVDALAATSQAITTSWVRYSFTYAVPSISGKTIGTNSFLNVRINHPNSNSTIDIWGLQMEAGSVATVFQTATGTLQGELSAAQRYYYRANATGGYSRFGLGQATGATTATVVVPFPVVMRTRPTALEQSGTASHYAAVNAGASSTLAGTSVPTFDSANTQTATVTFTVSTGLVAGNASQCTDNNTSSAYLGWSAEL
jgi:hypothetical protein